MALPDVVTSRHNHVFKRRLGEFREELLSQLGVGCAVDFPSYKQIVGRLQGLDDALKLADDADYEINGS